MAQQIYKGQQGTGFATVLGQQDMGGLEFFLKSKIAGADAASKAATARASQLADSFKKMSDENFDGWYKHEEEMQPLVDNLYSKGIALINAGIDPYNSTTPEALQYRKDAAYLKRMGQYSTQLKEDYKANHADLNDKENKFKVDDKLATVAYYEQDLATHIKGTDKPFLRVNAPEMHMAGLAKTILDGVKGSGGDFATNRPAIMEAWLKSADATNAAKTELIELEKTSPEEYKKLQSQAATSGKDITTLYMENYMDAMIVEPEFDIASYINKAVDINPTKKGYTNAEGGGSDKTIYNYAEFPSIAENLLNGNSRLQSAFVKEFGGTSFDATIKAKAIDYMVTAWKGKYKNETDSKANPIKDGNGGMSDDELNTNFNIWYRDFLAGNAEATSFVKGAKSYSTEGVEATAVPAPERWEGIRRQLLMLRANRDGALTKEDLKRLASLETALKNTFVFSDGSLRQGYITSPPIEDIEKFYTGVGVDRKFDMQMYVDVMSRQTMGNITREDNINKTTGRAIYEAAVRQNKFGYKQGRSTPPATPPPPTTTKGKGTPPPLKYD